MYINLVKFSERFDIFNEIDIYSKLNYYILNEIKFEYVFNDSVSSSVYIVSKEKLYKLPADLKTKEFFVGLKSIKNLYKHQINELENVLGDDELDMIKNEIVCAVSVIDVYLLENYPEILI